MNIVIETLLRGLSLIPALIYIAIPVLGLLAFRKRWAKKLFFVTISIPILLFCAGVFVDYKNGPSIFPASLAFPLFPYYIPIEIDDYITNRKTLSLYLDLVNDRSKLDLLVKRYPKLKKYEYRTMLDVFNHKAVNFKIANGRSSYEYVDGFTPEQIKQLWNKSTDESKYNLNIRQTIVMYPGTPKDLLRKIYEDEKADGLKFFSQIITNQNLPEDLIVELSRHNNSQIRMAVKYNPAYENIVLKQESR